MKKFVVVVIWCKDGVFHKDCVFCDDAKDAKESADLAERWYKMQGLEYDVAIYEKTESK